jgi:hypothetical protein
MSSAHRRMKLEDLAYSRLLKELEDSDTEEELACGKALLDTMQAQNNSTVVNMIALTGLLAMISEDIPGLGGKLVVKLLVNAMEMRRKNGSTIH